MKRAPILGTLFALACVSILVPAASTLATPKVGGHENGFNLCEESALHLYAQGAKAGLDVGRNRVDDGKLLQSGKVIPEPNPCAWRDKLDVMLNPPEPVAMSSPATTSQVAPTPATASVAPAPAGGCVGMDAESGSLGYAEPGGDGYVGCYQISEDHFNGGSCSGMSTDPAGQDACAAVICQTEGTGAWTNPSGQNPCGRLGG